MVEFESGRLKECDMTEFEKNSLIEYYRNENEILNDKINNIETILYKKYIAMKNNILM